MKTKEFIEKVEELGFDVEVIYYKKDDSIEIERRIVIRNKENKCVVSVVWAERVYEFDNSWICFTKLTEELQKKELFNLLIKYSSTPIEEREEAKKYYLKHKFLKGLVCLQYLFLNKHTQEYSVGSNYEYGSYQTKFTKKEIEKIKQKFNVSLDDFEIIEVE